MKMFHGSLVASSPLVFVCVCLGESAHVSVCLYASECSYICMCMYSHKEGLYVTIEFVSE